ncbi:hypothetical protein, partial [Streptomyces sp. NPDC059538]|uniref:hypothetical protein n=1 Tax=Streptomyces sp. NPDC059538 TaxID=3346860 RepID=UPI0036747DB5
AGLPLRGGRARAGGPPPHSHPRRGGPAPGPTPNPPDPTPTPELVGLLRSFGFTVLRTAEEAR